MPNCYPVPVGTPLHPPVSATAPGLLQTRIVKASVREKRMPICVDQFEQPELHHRGRRERRGQSHQRLSHNSPAVDGGQAGLGRAEMEGAVVRGARLPDPAGEGLHHSVELQQRGADPVLVAPPKLVGPPAKRRQRLVAQHPPVRGHRRRHVPPTERRPQAEKLLLGGRRSRKKTRNHTTLSDEGKEQIQISLRQNDPSPKCAPSAGTPWQTSDSTPGPGSARPRSRPKRGCCKVPVCLPRARPAASSGRAMPARELGAPCLDFGRWRGLAGRQPRSPPPAQSHVRTFPSNATG